MNRIKEQKWALLISRALRSSRMTEVDGQSSQRRHLSENPKRRLGVKPRCLWGGVLRLLFRLLVSLHFRRRDKSASHISKFPRHCWINYSPTRFISVLICSECKLQPERVMLTSKGLVFTAPVISLQLWLYWMVHARAHVFVCSEISSRWWEADFWCVSTEKYTKFKMVFVT